MPTIKFWKEGDRWSHEHWLVISKTTCSLQRTSSSVIIDHRLGETTGITQTFWHITKLTVRRRWKRPRTRDLRLERSSGISTAARASTSTAFMRRQSWFRTILIWIKDLAFKLFAIPFPSDMNRYIERIISDILPKYSNGSVFRLEFQSDRSWAQLF